MVLIDLFLAFFRIGLFAIGGAYAFLPVIEREIVEKYHWLSNSEFLDILGAVNIFPGAISIKFATYTGYKIAGVPGVIVANLGNLFAPVLIILFGTVFYLKQKNLPGVQRAFSAVQLVVFSMIIAVALRSVNVTQLLQVKNIFLVGVSFLLFVFTGIHPGVIIISAAILGLVW